LWHHRVASPYYSNSHRRFQKYCRTYINANIYPHVQAWEAAGGCPRQVAAEWVASSTLAFPDVPEEYRPQTQRIGGVALADWDAFHDLILLDELARIPGGCIFALEGGSRLGAPPLIHHGTAEQKRRWLPGLFTWETSICFGVSEESGGSDVAGIRTSAELSSDGACYEVTGSKKWVSGANWATHMTTAVRTGPKPYDISVLIVPLTGPGVAVEQLSTQGYRAAGIASVRLDKVRVPADHLLGRENGGLALLTPSLNKDRLFAAITSNRLARVCLSEALAHAHTRKTFGEPLASRAVIRSQLVALARQVEGNWAFVESMVYSLDKHGWRAPGLVASLAASKINGSETLEMAASRAQKMFGSAGCEQAEGAGGLVEMISRDVKCAQIGGGTDEILAELVWREAHKFAAKTKDNSRSHL
jgi:alkylation response protein AidB-like acyl-CoA dehydrogenase